MCLENLALYTVCVAAHVHVFSSLYVVDMYRMANGLSALAFSHYSGPGSPLLQHMALSKAIYSNEQGPPTAGTLLDHAGILGCQAEEDGDKESHTRCQGCWT